MPRGLLGSSLIHHSLDPRLRSRHTDQILGHTRDFLGISWLAYPRPSSNLSNSLMLSVLNGEISLRLFFKAPVNRLSRTRLTLRPRNYRITASSLNDPRSRFATLLGPSDNVTGILLRDQALAMAAAGATLGPLCDGLHSASDVLHYAHPTIRNLGPLALETCWYVTLHGLHSTTAYPHGEMPCR